MAIVSRPPLLELRANETLTWRTKHVLGKAKTTFFKDATLKTVSVLTWMVLHHTYAGSTK